MSLNGIISSSSAFLSLLKNINFLLFMLIMRKANNDDDDFITLLSSCLCVHISINMLRNVLSNHSNTYDTQAAYIAWRDEKSSAHQTLIYDNTFCVFCVELNFVCEKAKVERDEVSAHSSLFMTINNVRCCVFMGH